MTGLTSTEPEVTTLEKRYDSVRELTETLARPLSPEEQTVQSMPDVSPTKWHRAHTTWFFETFLLEPSLPGYTVYDPDYGYLFNSYYESLGARYPRPSRGLVTRPGASEIGRYRASVDDAMHKLIDQIADDPVAGLVELGLNHEQQHQELILMDIKHVLSQNLPQTAYLQTESPTRSKGGHVTAPRRIEHGGGLCEIGHTGNGFSFDNELPRHVTYLEPFSIDESPVTCAQWIEFIEDGSYERPDLWLSDGWAARCANGWESPLYWAKTDDAWTYFTLGGPREVCGSEPVCHVSYYEAEAFARWSRARLPTEAEWEAVASAAAPIGVAPSGNFLDFASLHPRPVGDRPSFFGDVWQWTASPYSPYPRFQPASGAVGEYNGKFMVNQYVLRGGCCATPDGHVRPTYRNFFPPSSRWAFSGLRLAHDC
jgi:ergothioneine biosynthesis protein EgtB